MANQTKSIREIIGENFSLSSFAKCMGISRPTLYKYMDAYDSGKLDLIPDNILKVFDTVSTRVPSDGLKVYFNDLYADYIRIEERRLRENPVPSDIAEIVDVEGLEVKDIDRMIEKAERHLDRQMKKTPRDEDEIERTKKDIRDLAYSRDMVERRQAENRFLLIFDADWTACIGPNESDIIDYDEDAESDVPDIDSKFRFYLTRAHSGYTLFFCNEGEGDAVEVQLLTGPREDKTRDVVGIFRPEPGMGFIRIPDLFNEEFEDFFQYRVVRSNGGRILNAAIGRFTVRTGSMHVQKEIRMGHSLSAHRPEGRRVLR